MRAPKFWRRPRLTWPAYALLPLSWVYGLLQKIDKYIKSLRPYYPGVPLISIGNITVGGSGKTPLVALLATHYAGKGYKVAVLSKGYGGTQVSPHCVRPADTAAIVGDEPLMLAHMLSSHAVDVWVGQNRKELAIRAEQAGAKLLIIDDGFQQYGIVSTVNILVIDGLVGYGNKQLLPAGPLREPLTQLKRANFGVVIEPVTENVREDIPPLPYYGLPAYHIYPHLRATDIKPLQAKSVIAVAGIGNPDKFFNSLTAAGLKVVETYPYPDHYALTAAEWVTHIAKAKANNAHLVCTAKDYVKIPQNVKQSVTPIHLSLTGEAIEDIFAEIDEKLA